MVLFELFAIYFYKILSFIPLSVLYKIGNGIASLVCFFNFLPFRQQTKRNLHQAFPEKDTKWINQTESEYYHRVCEFGAEQIHMFAPKNNERLQLTVKNIELLERRFQESDYVVCYAGHFLNYEILTYLPRMYPQFRLLCYYQSSGLKKVDQFIQSARSRFGAKLIPTSSPLKELIRIKNENKTHQKYILGSLADLKPSKAKVHYSPFFHKIIGVHDGTEKVGMKIGASFLYAKIIRKKIGSYEIEFIELKKNILKIDESVTDCFVKELEKNIQEQPDTWMLWATRRF